jgi:anthranilate synthase/aminodeoxychorismate synthase-like glutamine amidotransferase
MKVLVVDAFDSFTHNLCQQIGRLGAEVAVVTIDTPFETLADEEFDRIVLSPGPGAPSSARLFLEVIRELSGTVPILGICLGHQAICAAFGGRIRTAASIVHGRPATIVHDGSGLFHLLPSPITAVRYHSLVVDEPSLPSDLVVTAHAIEDGAVMGVRHRRLPVQGVQFHPESYLTPDGDCLIRNFLGLPEAA